MRNARVSYIFKVTLLTLVAVTISPKSFCNAAEAEAESRAYVESPMVKEVEQKKALFYNRKPTVAPVKTFQNGKRIVKLRRVQPVKSGSVPPTSTRLVSSEEIADSQLVRTSLPAPPTLTVLSVNEPPIKSVVASNGVVPEVSNSTGSNETETPASDRVFAPPYKYPFWGLPFGIYSNGGFINPGLFPFVPGGPGFPPYDGIFGSPFGPGRFPGNMSPFPPGVGTPMDPSGLPIPPGAFGQPPLNPTGRRSYGPPFGTSSPGTQVAYNFPKSRKPPPSKSKKKKKKPKPPPPEAEEGESGMGGCSCGKGGNGGSEKKPKATTYTTTTTPCPCRTSTTKSPSKYEAPDEYDHHYDHHHHHEPPESKTVCPYATPPPTTAATTEYTSPPPPPPSPPAKKEYNSAHGHYHYHPTDDYASSHYHSPAEYTSTHPPPPSTTEYAPPRSKPPSKTAYSKQTEMPYPAEYQVTTAASGATSHRSKRPCRLNHKHRAPRREVPYPEYDSPLEEMPTEKPPKVCPLKLRSRPKNGYPEKMESYVPSPPPQPIQMPLPPEPVYAPSPSPAYPPASPPAQAPAPPPVYAPAPAPVYAPAPPPVYAPAPPPVYASAPQPVYAPAPPPVYASAPQPVYAPAPAPVLQVQPQPQPYVPPMIYPQQPQYIATSGSPPPETPTSQNTIVYKPIPQEIIHTASSVTVPLPFPYVMDQNGNLQPQQGASEQVTYKVDLNQDLLAKITTPVVVNGPQQQMMHGLVQPQMAQLSPPGNPYILESTPISAPQRPSPQTQSKIVYFDGSISQANQLAQGTYSVQPQPQAPSQAVVLLKSDPARYDVPYVQPQLQLLSSPAVQSSLPLPIAYAQPTPMGPEVPSYASAASLSDYRILLKDPPTRDKDIYNPPRISFPFRTLAVQQDERPRKTKQILAKSDEVSRKNFVIIDRAELEDLRKTLASNDQVPTYTERNVPPPPDIVHIEFHSKNDDDKENRPLSFPSENRGRSQTQKTKFPSVYREREEPLAESSSQFSRIFELNNDDISSASKRKNTDSNHSTIFRTSLVFDKFLSDDSERIL